MAITVRSRVVTVCALAAVAAAGLSCASGPGGAPPMPWADMTHEQRVAHMKHVVLPAMKLEFEEWKPDEFSEMDCASCHGDGARDETFRMPNPRLPKLPGGPDGFERLMAEKPEETRFMVNVVVAKMAAMLGEKPYDGATHNGFGCFRCHTTE